LSFAVITMQHNIVLTYLQYDLVLTLILTFIIVSLIEYNITSDFRTTVKSADVFKLDALLSNIPLIDSSLL